MAWTLDLDFLELALQIKYHDRKLEFLPKSILGRISKKFLLSIFYLSNSYVDIQIQYPFTWNRRIKNLSSLLFSKSNWILSKLEDFIDRKSVEKRRQ